MTLPPIFATRPAGHTIEAMVSTVDARESSLAFSSGVMFFARCTPLMICCLALAAITPAWSIASPALTCAVAA